MLKNPVAFRTRVLMRILVELFVEKQKFNGHDHLN